jgi:polyisoprenoid-binding protein YceI
MKTPVCASLLAALLSAPVQADWTLDPARSHLSFISIKAKDVAEIHTFKEMTGVIDGDGNVSLTLMLDSVETLVPIRNERMREFLFDTTDYKEAVLRAKVDPAAVAGLGVGEVTTITAEGNLSLHGAEQPMTMLFQVAKLSSDAVMAASAKPLVIDAAKFGLEDGIEKLREIAGLASISHAVPVTFVVTFVDAGGE